MNRYIDADELEKSVCKSLKDNPHTDGIVRKTHIHEHEHFIHLIHRTPTINPEDLYPKWISVKDRLPEVGEDVLVCDARETEGFVSMWNFRKLNKTLFWSDTTGMWRELDEVTHWKPLPKAPEV